jgi:hypothetical protein
MRSSRSLLVACVIACGVPATARADGFFTPFAGINFGGSTGVTAQDSLRDRSRLDFGVATGGMIKGIVGFEFDLGYSGTFYGTSSAVKQTNVLTAMGNLIVGVPIGGTTGAGVRPYISGGVGIIRRDFEFASGLLSTQNTDLGFDLGVGLNIYLTDHFGFRGDLRHFRASKGDGILNGVDFGTDAFNFTRAAVGIVIRY